MMFASALYYIYSNNALTLIHSLISTITYACYAIMNFKNFV